MNPLLVIDDIVVMDRGLTLLPAVPRQGLPIVAGDTVDLCTEEGRSEALVLAVDADPHDPTRVRLRIAPTVHASRGVEVWPSESSSRVVLKTPESRERRVASGDVLRVSGGVARRRTR
jgi:hypothetical protein